MKVLLDYKSKSEARIKHLEEELKAIKSKKRKENVVDMCKTEQLGVDFE